jgi:hypothetical protein
MELEIKKEREGEDRTRNREINIHELIFLFSVEIPVF